MKFSYKRFFFKLSAGLLICFACLIICLFFSKVSQTKEIEKPAIEEALYTRVEFFGAKAIVPFPTHEARERLAKVLESGANNPEIYLKLSELDEKVGNYALAEDEMKKFIELEPEKTDELLNFYRRRARFEKEAETLEKMLAESNGDKRAAIFSRLIQTAQTHDLQKYLQPDFYAKILAEQPEIFSILAQYLDKLIEENPSQALRFLRENKSRFPDRVDYFLEKELSLVNPEEAETVYHVAFNPFWTEDESRGYYEFLSANDRYRAYGNELKARFKKNPADFDTAIRLIHFEKYDNNPISNLILKHENERAEKNIRWTSDELLIVSRFLLAEGENDLATRFLYTLFLQEDVKTEQSAMRAKVLYQIFRIFIEAGNERLTLAKGDLQFYKNIASADLNPGISTGILSLIFSGTNPEYELEEKERTAAKFFNRAAAFQIFTEYKKEFPTSPELASMYLDIIKIYTDEKDLEIAAQTLSEFQGRYENAADFPPVALKLAEAFQITGKSAEERAVYQKILDFLGADFKKEKFLIYPLSFKTDNRFVENYDRFLSKSDQTVTYQEVLQRFVASLERDKKSNEIFSFYAAELQKYPEQEKLYEQFLAWLEKTNLTEEQLKIYGQALDKFPEKSWQDRLARWFIRNGRKQEFEDYSRQILQNFDDEETRQFLAEFVDSKAADKPESFNGKLYFGLYSLAHKRFPHNQTFVYGLLKFYKTHKLEGEYRKLLAEYYFESPEIRQEFLAELAKTGEIRKFFDKAEENISSPNNLENLPYKLFRADASAWISNYETAIDAYRELNQLYPQTPVFLDRLISFTRSFGQKERKFLIESANYTVAQAENFPDNSAYRTVAGEIYAELGDYEKANGEWRKLIQTAKGENETYLETATVFWDYFQFPEAIKTIKNLREKQKDETLFAFQAGAIYEADKDLSSALGEYVKALNSEKLSDKHQTKKRLKDLIKRENVAEELENAFEIERAKQKDSAWLTLGYCEFLGEIKKIEQAEELLRPEIADSVEVSFLDAARNFFSSFESSESERFVIKRLAEISGKSGKAFSYRFQLAESYADEGNISQTVTVLDNLIAENPLNYGVINESSNFFWRIGERGRAVQILQTATNSGRGEYRYNIARKLASRLVSQNRLSQAENVLLLLNSENKEDGEVIDELTNIYVQTNQPEKLRRIADEKIKAIKNQNTMPRGLKFEIIETRKRLVNAFTRLKDYRSAVEQQIEIINLEPETTENIDEAVSYVKRFGGADVLLDYYLKTAAESYKNHRWNVVLAKIYEAHGDFMKSAENYKIAIHNQPENIDLYVALAETQENSNDFTAALDTINKILEIAGEDKIYINRKIKLLEKLGRNTEAEIEKQKLSEENLPKPDTLAEQFQEAANLRNTERAKAIELYKNAFDKIYENPAEAELKSADVTAYVQTVRGQENLDEILKKLWNLRERLVDESGRKNSTEAGKIRDLLNILDGAMPEAVCGEAKLKATGNEISAIFRDIENRLDQTKNNQFQQNSLLQNLINNCGFTKLNEKILIIRKDEAFDSNNSKDYHFRLRLLIDFYEKQGDVSRILELLEAERARDFDKKSFAYERLIAENARLLGNSEKELDALRDYYNAVTEPSNQADIYVGRYLEILYQTNRDEMQNLARAPNANIFQLIGFLISKKEGQLAHLAIENYPFSKFQKLRRNAEASLALNEFYPQNESYFLDALRHAPIGELVRQTPEKDAAAVGNDWFEMAEKYGRWLYLAPTTDKTGAREFLPALIENRPNDANEQVKLGKFYLEQKDFGRAFEHFNLANEKNPNDVSIKINLGVCYFQLGEPQKAEQIWNNSIESETASIADAEIYLKTLSEYGQAAKARENLKPFLIHRLKNYSESGFSEKTENENLNNFIQFLSKTFRDEEKQFIFFEDITKAVKYNSFLPEIVVRKQLVSRKYLGEFYQLLIGQSAKLSVYEQDYDFTSLSKGNFSDEEAEFLLDQHKNYEISESQNDRLIWQKEYLEFLLTENRNQEAEKLIEEIEFSLQEKFARPVWLRLAKIRLALRENSPSAFEYIEKFVGIEVSPNAAEVKPPNIERLNDVITVLQSEKRPAETEDKLKEAFYARMLALEQLDAANFTALAQVLFSRGTSDDGLNLLKLMHDIAGEERKEIAQAELAKLAFIKKYSQKEAKLLETKAVNNLNQIEVLQTSAEICARFGHFADAEFYRHKLFSIAPENESNRLELARIFWVNSKPDETLKMLGEIIGNRETTRKSRWQAVLIAAEIFAGNSEMWEKLKVNLRHLQQTDAETWSAMEIFSLYKTGNVSEAFSYSRRENLPYSSPQFGFLKAVIAKDFGQENIALQEFIEISDKDSELNEIFGGFYEKPLRQAIRLYLKLGKPLAALKLAGTQNDLQIENPSEISNASYLSLAEKSDYYERKSGSDLLGLLSKAAEETGELNRAAGFEQTRLKLAFSDEEKMGIERRIEELNSKAQ